MSGWAAYIDSITKGSPAIKRAAIIGLTDGSVWTRTEAPNVFAATEGELKKLVNYFIGENYKNVPSSGADIENVHYIVPRADENLIFGKKDKTGFFAYKTKQAVVVAIYEGENTASDVRAVVEKVGGYLESINY